MGVLSLSDTVEHSRSSIAHFKTMKPFLIFYSMWIATFLLIAEYFKGINGVLWVLSGVLGFLILLRRLKDMVHEELDSADQSEKEFDPVFGFIILISLVLTAFGLAMLIMGVIGSVLLSRALKRWGKVYGANT